MAPITLQRSGTRLTVPAGGYSDIIYSGSNDPLEPPLTVAITPGSGGTALVQYTLSSVADIEAGAAVWHNWPLGTISSYTEDTRKSKIMGLRASATTAAALFEVIG